MDDSNLPERIDRMVVRLALKYHRITAAVALIALIGSALNSQVANFVSGSVVGIGLMAAAIQAGGTKI